jgi:hypothetical protein
MVRSASALSPKLMNSDVAVDGMAIAYYQAGFLAYAILDNGVRSLSGRPPFFFA